MRRILFGLLLIAGAGSAIAAGATGAFFSDTETSTGNTFAAGAIDLKIDNESYYNGNKCGQDVPDGPFVWQGNALFPVPGTPCTTSFPLSDLGNGLLFFNFSDLKPSDNGEDTISLHVNDNPAYLCMDMTLTSNDDKSSTEPELSTPDVQEDINNTWDGELAQNVNMLWWADDGDNVYEVGESSISGGIKSLMDLASTTGAFSATLADSTQNVWNPNNAPGPIPGGQTQYIAKDWCFGTMGLTPVAQDSLGHTGTNGPQVRGSGFTCNGAALNNLTQTDAATVDVAFRAVQSRNNSSFTCGNTQSRVAKITVTKIVSNIHGGNNVVADFQLSVDNGIVTTNVTSGIQTQVSAGAYTVGETGVSGYIAQFGGDCAANGSVTLNPGDVKACTITNTDQEAHITLIKSVIGPAAPTTFGLTIDGNSVQNNSSVTVNSNTPHTINEGGRVRYHFVSLTGNAKCPVALGGTATLDEGESITCTITNQQD